MNRKIALRFTLVLCLAIAGLAIFMGLLASGREQVYAAPPQSVSGEASARLAPPDEPNIVRGPSAPAAPQAPSGPAAIAAQSNLTKTVTPTTDVAYHGTVTYTVVLSNSGTADDPNVLFTDTLPTKVDFASWVISPTGTALAGDVITWTGTVTAGEALTWTFAVTHTGNYGDVVTNTAEFSGTQQTGSAEDTFTVAAPDMAVSKDVTPTTDVAYHGTVTYTVVLSNSGTADDPNVLFTDTLPTKVDFASWVISPTGTALAGDVITWTGTVTAGEALTWTFAVTHTGNYGDVVTNTAEFSGTQQTGSAEDTFTVAAPDMAVSKDVTSTTDVAYHGTVTYTVVLSNSGTADDPNVLFTDTLPTEVDFASWVISPTGTALASDVITWTGTVTAGEALTWTFAVTHTGNYGDVVTNTAEFSGTQQTGSAEDTFTVAAPDMAVSKDVTPTTDVAYHGTVTYTVVLSNSGTADDPNVLFTDTLPTEVDFASWVISPTGTALAGDVITWTGTVTAGEALTWTFAVTHTGNYGDVVTNTAEFSGTQQTGSAEDTFTVAAPDMAVSKDVTSTTDVAYHGTVTYTVVLSNSGTADDPNVLFTDTLPIEVDFASWVISPTGTALAGDVITWTGTVTAGEALTWTFAVTHTGNYGEVVTNTAEFSGTLQAAEDDAVFTVELSSPNLTLSKDVTPTTDVAYHSVVTYTVVLSNSGALSDTGVLFTDTLPTEVDFASWVISPTGTALAGDVITWTGTVTAGEALTWTFAVTHTGNYGDVVTNTAEFSGTLQAAEDDAVFTVELSPPNLTLSKTVNITDPTPGQVITYTVVVTNSGGENATVAVISDTQPAHLTFGPVTIDPSGACTTGTLPILAQCPTITAGQSVTVTFPVTVDVGLPHGTTITNTAAVTSVEVSVPQTGSKAVTVQAPDLVLTKNLQGNFSPGQVITYTVVVVNNGGQHATGALITDTWKPTNALTVAGPVTLDPPSAGMTGTFPYTLAHDVTITAGKSVTITFPVTVNASLIGGMVVTNTAAVTSAEGVTDGYVLTTTVARPQPAWEKLVYVNGTLTTTRPIVVRAGDAISIVDQVWVTYTVPITFTLVETWTDSLDWIGVVTDTGNVFTSTNSLTWDVDGITPTMRYAITKTFVVTGGFWTYDFVTETLWVETADPQPPMQVLTFAHGCEPVTGVDFAWMPYPSPQPGDVVAFTATPAPYYATTPIAYAWDISGTLRNGNPVYYTFLYSDTYPVTVTAANACGGPVTMPHNVVVSGTTPFTPSYGVELAPAADSDSGSPSETVTYTLQVTNTGNVADTFDLSWAGHAWPTDVTPDWVNLPPSGTHQITVTVTIPPGAQPGGSDTVVVTVTSQSSSTVSASSILTTAALRPEPDWDKQVYVNGIPATTSPITVIASDTIQIVDRVWVTYTVPITFTLVETWTDSLDLTNQSFDTGSVVVSTNALTWTAPGVAPNTWHAITKTFQVTGSTWAYVYDFVTETLEVEGADPQLPERVLTFEHGCEPVTSVGLGWLPANPEPGDVVTFTATLTPSYATPPVTYTWDISGTLYTVNPVYHTFLYSDTYTVFVTATNPCGGPVVMSHTVVVSGTPFAPTYGVELAPPTDTGSGNPGSDVVYTLWVTNTGDAADTFDLSQTGDTWTTGVTPPSVNLPPAGTHQVTVTVAVPAGTQCGDSDTVTATATSQGNPAESDSSMLTTSANAVSGVEMAPPTDGQNGDPGETVTYTLRVTNTGNCTDTFTVGASGNAWTTNAPATIGPLASGAVTDVIVTVTVTDTATPGQSDTVTIAATSQGDGVTSDSSVLTTTANRVYNVEMMPPTDAKSGDPGAAVTYTLWVTNTGNDTDAFTVTVSNDDWLTTLSITETGNLAAGDGISVVVTVTVTAGAQCTDSDIVTITATSQGDGVTSDSSVLTTTANPAYSVEVTPPTDGQNGDPGETVTYTLRVTNTGNCTDTFTVGASGNTWTTNVSVPAGPLASGAVTDVVVTVDVPTGALPNDTVTVTVGSMGNPAESDSSVLTTTANRVYNVEVMPPTDAKSGDPGTAVTYTLWVTNTGNDTDAFTVTVSGDDWFTTLSITETGNLVVGDGISVVVTVVVQAGAQCTDSDTVTITATSQGDGVTSDSGVLTTSADAVYDVAMAPPTDTQNGDPGETVTYTLRITNTGNCTDTFDVTVSDDDWTTNAQTPIGPLAVGAGADVEVTVDVPAGTPCGDSDTAIVTATSRGDGTTSDSSGLTTSVNPVYGANVTPPTDAKWDDPGETVTYTLQVANAGNCTDTFDISVSGDDWTTNAPSSAGPLASGAITDVVVTVDIPLIALPNESDTVTVTATSQHDGSASDSSTLMTTVICTPVVEAGFTFTPTASLAGEMVTFTGSVTPSNTTLPITYTWEFDDGGTGSGQVIAHTWGFSGTYGVVMTATNCCPSQDVATRDVAITGEPHITVNPLSLNVVLNIGYTTIRELTISNASTATADLNWSLAESPAVGWLDEIPANGLVIPSGSTDADVTFDTGGLASGIYTTTLRVSSNDLDKPQVDVSVTLTVTDDCIPVSGVDFDFAPPNPQVDDVVTFSGIVDTASTQPVIYTWDFGGGDTAAGQVVTHTWGFSGTYSVVMTATNGCGEDTATHDVAVTGEPDITVDPLSLSALLEPGGTTIRQLVISNTNTATANLNWSLAEIPAATWLSQVPGSGMVVPAGSDTVIVTFDATGLSENIYNTTLRVNSNDPDEPVVDVDVVLTVDSCIPVSDADIITPTEPRVDKPATFTATVNSASSLPILYTWDFGDGTPPVQSGWEYARTYVVQHTYTTSDTYHVVMTATNCTGASMAVDSKNVVVPGEPGISVEPLSLSAVLNPNTGAGQTKPRQLTIGNADGATADLIWRLVEMPTVSWLGETPTSGVISPSESDDVQVIFNSTGWGVGVHTTTLRFRSNDLDDPEVTVDVTLEVVAGCIEVDGADFDFAPTGPLTTGVTVVFTGSVEQGSLPIDYVWSFGDGTPPVAQSGVWAHTSVVAHTYTDSETGYNVVMMVSNSCSEDTASRRVGSPIVYLPLVLRNYPCTAANIGALDSDSPVELGEVMRFAATVEGSEPIVYAWDFGGAGTQGGTDTNPTFTYDAANTYTVTLTVTNACGTDSDFITVTVTSPCDPVDITALDSDSPVVLGEAMHFTATVTGTQPITYAWDFGGAGMQGSTETNPTFTYDAADTYTVTLVVTNACGTDSDFITVTVSSAVVANFIPSTPPVSKVTTLTTGVIPSNAVAAYAWNAGGRRRQ